MNTLNIERLLNAVLETAPINEKIARNLTIELNRLEWPEYGSYAVLQPDLRVVCGDNKRFSIEINMEPKEGLVPHAVFHDSQWEADVGVVRLDNLEEDIIVENLIAIHFCEYAQKRCMRPAFFSQFTTEQLTTVQALAAHFICTGDSPHDYVHAIFFPDDGVDLSNPMSPEQFHSTDYLSTYATLGEIVAYRA